MPMSVSAYVLNIHLSVFTFTRDEHLVLADLRRATKVVARTLFDLLKA